MPEQKHSIKSYRNKIMVFLNKNGKKPLAQKDLAAKCKSKKGSASAYSEAYHELIRDGVIFEKKKGVVLCAMLGYFPATIKRLSKTFGFAERSDDSSEVFIPGKFLMGAMPEDSVLLHLIPSRTGQPEGEVVSILIQNDSQMTGKLITEDGKLCLLPDMLTKTPLRIINSDPEMLHEGDKVLAEIAFRGMRHSEHKVKILMSFGSAGHAASCALSMLSLHGIDPAFPKEVIAEAQKIEFNGIHDYDFAHRLDLRSECIFTIDGADTKDIDDAISVHKLDNGYLLGVHIADVSHYVRANTALDNEAMKRGTSVYYADKVIPMLPKELSNGICSLNPNETRLAFSSLVRLDPDGKIVDFEFKKTVICSRVKGVYSEINTILDGTATAEIKKKYDRVSPCISVMNELADILIANRIKRGAPEIETAESKLIINDDGICCDVIPRTRGKSECIIEEFMLIANECAARLARKKEAPFVYRCHEKPAPEKIQKLKEMLEKLGIECPQFTNPKPAHLAQILNSARDKESFPVINSLVLRSMAKAKYAPEPIGHFGLALADYAHFTSPIRRYPDLSIHRILNDMLAGYDGARLHKRYDAFVHESSEKSTAAEIAAMTVERDCESCYKAEFMQAHLGEEFEGIISGVMEYGFYVELQNTVEGLVHMSVLGDGEYSFDGMISLIEYYSGKAYTVGDKIKVKCIKADVNSGNIDFALA